MQEFDIMFVLMLARSEGQALITRKLDTLCAACERSAYKRNFKISSKFRNKNLIYRCMRLYNVANRQFSKSLE